MRLGRKPLGTKRSEAGNLTKPTTGYEEMTGFTGGSQPTVNRYERKMVKYRGGSAPSWRSGARDPQRRIPSWTSTDGSGVEVLKFIRQHDLKLSVVVLTSNPYDALRSKCQSLGAASVLDKLEGLDQCDMRCWLCRLRLKVN